MKNDIILLEHLKVLQQKLSSTKVPNRKLVKESLSISDISGSSTMNGKGNPLKDDKYFIIHHTAGRSTAQGVVGILNSRKLGVQWVIDREAKIYQTLPKGSFGQHVAPDKGTAPSDLSNRTSQGVEIVGSNDKDILIKQCKSNLLLIKDLGYSLSNIYGHGEVQSNKQPTEGQKCKRYATKYWNTPEDELPDVDDELGKDLEPTNNTNKGDSDDLVDVEGDPNVVIPPVIEPKKSPFEFLKNLGGIFKKKEDLKIEEDVQRIKNLLK
jgi:hypothetical protein